jgi:putative ABC transport system permease protein
MALLRLAAKSLLNRRFTLGITLVSMALSLALLLGVERLRTQVKASFTNTISGTDLIIGARSGPMQLLLYSVFRMGSATNNLSWQGYQQLLKNPAIAWAIPLSLGDSHRGYRVLGTTGAYFQHYRFGDDQPLTFAKGQAFADLYDLVLGSEVAQTLGYGLGDQVVVSHGIGQVSFARHEDKPFRVVGILKPTGTPVDRSLHLSLEAIEAIHLGWQSGSRMPGSKITAEAARSRDLTPTSITAVLVGLKSKTGIFRLQRAVNDYAGEPLMAVLPGVALSELWGLMATGEYALLLVSAAVVLVGLLGMLTAMLAGLNERRREMAILRSVGARPWHVLALIEGEALVLGLAASLLGLGLLYLGLGLVQPLLQTTFGLFIRLGLPGSNEWLIMAAMLLAVLLAGLVPALRAYRTALADGLSMRL